MGDLAPIVVVCHLCIGGGEIVTVWPRCWYAAMDHALDEHRAELLAAPGDTLRAFTVAKFGRALRLTPGPELRRR